MCLQNYCEQNMNACFLTLRGKGEVPDEILFSTLSGTEFYVLSSDAV